jgi:hypothetical protein
MGGPFANHAQAKNRSFSDLLIRLKRAVRKTQPFWFGGGLSRDNLDENGRRQSELEAAAGSEVMIDLSR